MDNLAELISRVLARRGETVTAFAARIGVNRLTVATWKSSLPAADTLRRVADDLAIPYSVVLAAALASAGYAASVGDLMAGQQVHVVTHFGDGEADDGAASVVFTDPARAMEYMQAVSANPDLFGVEDSVVTVDGAEIPDTIQVFTTVWSSRTDEIRQSTSLSCSVPTRLEGRDVTAVEATALTDADQIVSLHVDSLTSEAGLAALTSAVAMLRQQGRLMPPGIDPYPAVSGRVAYLMAKQAKGSAPSPQPGAEPLGSLRQAVPAAFAAAHDSARANAGGPEAAPAVWPLTRRFVVLDLAATDGGETTTSGTNKAGNR